MDHPPSSHPSKPKSKAKKSYPHPPKKSSSSWSQTAPPTIQPGDAGIWATCTKGKEGKATVDLLDLFAQFAEALYGIHNNIAPAPAPALSSNGDVNGTTALPIDRGPDSPPTINGAPEDEDIESSITAELSTLRRPRHSSPNPSNTPTPTPPKLIQPIRLTTPCLLFFRTSPPLDPVFFVTTICRSFAFPTSNPSIPHPPQRYSRFIKRLTPIPLTSKATPTSLLTTARTVLSAAGLTSPPLPTITNATFAIRPTIRDHHVLSRSTIIESVAPLVGTGWSVNLTKPGKVVVVEVWRNVCGVVVLEGEEWMGLERFNLAELGDAPRENNAGTGQGGGGGGGGAAGGATGDGDAGKRKRDVEADGEEGNVAKSAKVAKVAV